MIGRVKYGERKWELVIWSVMCYLSNMVEAVLCHGHNGYINMYERPNWQTFRISLLQSPRIKRHTDCILSDTLVQNYQNLCHRQNVDLYGLVCVCFLFPVSHIVVPEGQMPTTYSTLMGLLAGYWIVRYKCKYREGCKL